MRNILKVLLVTILAVATALPLVACGGGSDVTTPEVTTPEVTTPEGTTPEEPDEPVQPTHTHNTGKYVATIAAADSAFGVGYELWGCTEEGCGYCELYVSDEADGHTYVDGTCACATAEIKQPEADLDFRAVVDSTGEWAKYEDAATGLYYLLKIPKFYDFENTFFGESEDDAFTTYKDFEYPLNVENGLVVYQQRKPITITEGSSTFEDRGGVVISFTLTMNAYTESAGNSQFISVVGLDENGEPTHTDYIMMTSTANDDADPSTPHPKSASGLKNPVKFELGVGSRVEFVFTPDSSTSACKVYVDGVHYANAVSRTSYRSAVTYFRIGQKGSDANQFDIDDLVVGKFMFEDSAEAILVADTLDFSNAADHDYTDVINGFIARSLEYAEAAEVVG